MPLGINAEIKAVWFNLWRASCQLSIAGFRKQSYESRVCVLGMANTWERNKQGKVEFPSQGNSPTGSNFPLKRRWLWVETALGVLERRMKRDLSGIYISPLESHLQPCCGSAACSSHWGFQLILPVPLWSSDNFSLAALCTALAARTALAGFWGRLHRLWWWGQSPPRRFLLTGPFPSSAINTS